jgi:hypothetical protein
MFTRKKLKGTITHFQDLKKRWAGCAPPRGYYRTSKDWLASLSPQKRKQHQIREHVFPSQRLNREPPITIGDDLYWQFQLDYGQHSQPAFILSIENGRFWKDSAVITPDNYLLSDLSIYMKVDPDSPRQHPIFHSEITASVYFDQTVAVLSAPGGNTFFHWMIDALPRYAILKQAEDWLQEIDYFLVNGTDLAFQAESLALLGIPKNKIISSKEYPHITAKRLIIPSFIRHQTCNVGPWVFDFLRHELMPETSKYQGQKSRVYVSREKASSRKLTNEDEIFAFLEPLGFKKYFLEELSLADQINIFSAAEFVIAPHGAGLTNLIFCPNGAKVLEIYSPNYVSVSYWNICCQNNIGYYYLFGKPIQVESSQQENKRKEDICVIFSDFVDITSKMLT